MELMTKEELSTYLKVPLGTVKYLLYQKKLPKIKVGREYRFLKEDINQWIHHKKEPPIQWRVRKW